MLKALRIARFLKKLNAQRSVLNAMGSVFRASNEVLLKKACKILTNIQIMTIIYYKRNRQRLGLCKHLRVSQPCHSFLIMMKSIYLIDGGFFVKKYKEFKKDYPTAEEVKDFIVSFNKKYNSDSNILRIYYYDCPPFDGKITKVVSKEKIDLKETERYKNNKELLQTLKRTDLFSVREGSLSYRGWKFKKSSLKKIKKKEEFNDDDFNIDFSQKGVDIKIGLDIAWISLEKIAEKIILITGDADFIPAMKFARRKGIQVTLLTLNHGVRDELKDHADFLIEKNIKEIIDKK